MKVTNLDYFLENKLIKKLDIMIDRVVKDKPKKDAVFIFEGAEGEGKTNASVASAYYVKHKTSKEIHMFFRLKELIDFAKSTEGKIIIWDEPALDALSTDWYNQINQDFIRLLMTIRKRRHFLMINLTKFYKFSEYIVVDRSLGLIHMYSRNELTPGRFVYIKRRFLEPLYRGYKVSKRRLYKSLCSFRGSFPEVMENYFHRMGIIIEGRPNCSLEDYDRLKDEAIQSIGNKDDKEETIAKLEVKKLKGKLGRLKTPIKTRVELSEKLKIPLRTIQGWTKKYQENA